METRKLGNSDIKITRVGFGAWALGGGGWEFAWGPQDDADSIAAIHRALQLGVRPGPLRRNCCSRIERMARPTPIRFYEMRFALE